ncbi:hypothetical protein ACFFP0_30010 [Rhizobium puerariae]|uniref:EamA family transporter n=1 Tax=Rhizobium puerariae TaxID=1585791 RepID=A0ABV6AR44_9HYPH
MPIALVAVTGYVFFEEMPEIRVVIVILVAAGSGLARTAACTQGNVNRN